MADRMLKSAFFISPIGQQNSAERTRSNQVLNHIVRPVLLDLHYDITRADEIQHPGIITTQIIDRVINDDLIVADLTDYNPNVFYELAIRHTIKKPFIQMILFGSVIPFDIAGVRTIFYNHNDLDNVAQTKEAIRQQVLGIDQLGYDVESPVTAAIDITTLRGDSRTELRSLADIIEGISEIKRELKNFENSPSYRFSRVYGAEIQEIILRSNQLESAVQKLRSLSVLMKNLNNSSDFGESTTKNKIGYIEALDKTITEIDEVQKSLYTSSVQSMFPKALVNLSRLAADQRQDIDIIMKNLRTNAGEDSQ